MRVRTAKLLLCMLDRTAGTLIDHAELFHMRRRRACVRRSNAIDRVYPHTSFCRLCDVVKVTFGAEKFHIPNPMLPFVMIVYFGAVVSVVIFLLVLLARFVKAHERIATALEETSITLRRDNQ